MEKTNVRSNDLYFLSGGGEMGALIRARNWKNTILGDPLDWPQSLQTMMAVMLSNPFGMYIAWGNDYTQIYNDGYRPILGSTKHPDALGISSRQTFKEIWHIIGPMFEGVMNGEAVGFSDFMLPLDRNGFVEACYFDFSYSPIRKEDGAVGGVLVTVIETTNKKKVEEALKESETQIRNIINSLPLVIWTAAPDGGLTSISHQWEEFYGNPVKESLGNGWAQYVHPDDIDTAANQWASSLKNGSIYEAEFRVLHKSGDYRWILVRAVPTLSEEGTITSWNGSNTDIHDKKLSVEAARRSEELFKAMADNIPNLAWMANAEGWIYWYNKQWYEYSGTTPEQMEGWGWQTVHDPAELPKVMQKWKASIESGEPFEMIFPLKRADGKFRQFLTRVLPVLDSEGYIRQWFGTNTDITAQIEIEQSLKESEERFRTMAEGTDILIATSDETSNATYFNKAYSQLTGRSMQDLLEFGWVDMLHPEDRENITASYMNAFNERRPIAFECRLLNKAGEYRWLLIQAIQRLRPNGTFAGYISSGVDITERKNAERAVREKEQNLRNTIIQAPVAMCILKGPEYVVDLANERMIELWGKTRGDVLHKPIFEGLPEAKDQGLEVLLDGVYATGTAFSAEGLPISLPRNGRIETVYVNFVYEAYKEDDGSVSGILAVAVDVTAQVIARQKIEEVVAERTRELENANRDLQRSNDELAQFAYIASHDLQEPLRKISTFSQMLSNSLGNDLSDQAKNYLLKINTSTSRMTTLIRDVLTYSELVKDKEIFEEVDLNQIVESIKTDYELLIEQKGASILHQNLPTIEAIPLQMSQLFGNLLGNALKFARTNVQPVITITALKLSGDELINGSMSKNLEFCKIQVADNGIGFKQEYADQIFHIFQRLHRKADYEGTGIGLAMCKKIAVNHQGYLNADGSSENGAVFNVILPIKQKNKKN